VTERLRKIGNAATHLGNTVDAADEVAKEGAKNRDGWGFVHKDLDDLTDGIVANRPDEVSVTTC